MTCIYNKEQCTLVEVYLLAFVFFFYVCLHMYKIVMDGPLVLFFHWLFQGGDFRFKPLSVKRQYCTCIYLYCIVPWSSAILQNTSVCVQEFHMVVAEKYPRILVVPKYIYTKLFVKWLHQRVRRLCFTTELWYSVTAIFRYRYIITITSTIPAPFSSKHILNTLPYPMVL